MPGTCIGHVALDKPEDTRSVTVRQKREIYGKRGRIPVGGRNPENADGKRADTDWEPVFWWPFPVTFYEELLHLCPGERSPAHQIQTAHSDQIQTSPSLV